MFSGATSMTLIKQLYDSVITRAHNQDRPPAINMGAGIFSGLGITGGANIVQQMITYTNVSWVFAAVSRIAEAVASSEWHLYRGPGNTNEVTNHPALTLWQSANEFDSRQDFLEMSQQHYELTGESWWVLVRNAQRVPVEMWAVRPDRMSPVKHPTDYITGYTYQIGSERIHLDLEDVIFTRHPTPLDPYRGVGAIQSLMLDLGSEVEAANYNRAFFRNDATPGGIIKTDRSINDADFDKLVERWKTFHQGTSNAGRIGFLERADFIERKFTQRDMQFTQLRMLNRDMILAAFGVPLPMVGTMEAPSRANAQAAEYIFARWTIKPRLNRIKLSLNTKLLPLFPDRGLHFDFEDPTPNNRELDIEEANSTYASGLRMQNEGRALLGLADVPDGDEFFSTGGGGGFDPFTLGVKQREVSRKIDKLQRWFTPSLKAPTQLEMAERLMQLAWERRLRTEVDSLVAYLEDILGKTMCSCHHLAITHKNGICIMNRDVCGCKGLKVKIELSDLQGFDWNWWERYGEEVIEELTSAIRAGILAEWPGIEPALADTLAAEYARNRGARLLRLDGDLNLVNVTRDRVNSLVAQTIESGDSLQTLQASLRNDFAFSPEKARTVARTETATAQGQGARQAAAAQGFDEKRWITQGDDVVDANGNSTPCLDAEAQGWIKIGDPFISGFDTIPAHPNCFPGFVAVEGRIEAGLKAWYSGQLIRIKTQSGVTLAVTPNHPILTANGFVPAAALKQGDQVVRYHSSVEMARDIDHEQLEPSLISEIFDSLWPGGPSAFANISPEDLHGDGQGVKGQIEIVRADGILLVYSPTSAAELKAEVRLALTDMGLADEVGLSPLPFTAHRVGRTAPRLVGGVGLTGYEGWDNLDALPLENLCVVPPAYWHTRSAEMIYETKTNDSRFLAEMFHGFPSQVSFDEVVQVGNEEFSGHVYDLQSPYGWIIAEGLVVSNCRCNVRYRVAPLEELGFVALPRVCSRCLKIDTIVENRNGSGFWCQRCNLAIG